jgi:hypothetical protein
MKGWGFVTATLLPAALLTGCGGVNSYLADRHETVEMYHIFDLQTPVEADIIIKAAADGLARNTNTITQTRPLMMGAAVPAKAGRFQLVDVASMLPGGMSAFAQLAAMHSGGTPMRAAKCDGAIWTSRATRNISGYNNLTLYNCLYAYKGGYQLDIYAVFQKTSGGASALATGISDALIGTPESWVDKTIIDTVRSMQRASGGTVSHLEGQPKIGDLPWVDKYSSQ